MTAAEIGGSRRKGTKRPTGMTRFQAVIRSPYLGTDGSTSACESALIVGY